ncbi:MAG: DUF6498-containing protein [Patescibacteria group bacterium]
MIKFSTRPAIASLIAANVVAGSFAFFGGATPASLLTLYWLETWIIGFYNVLKIRKAAKPMTPVEEELMRKQAFGKVIVDILTLPSHFFQGKNFPAKPREKPLTPRESLRGPYAEVSRESVLRVFIAQYSFIVILYGAMLFGFIIYPLVSDGAARAETANTAPFLGMAFSLAISFFALCTSHGVSYMTNFLGKSEFLNVSPARQMLQPFDRIIAMHLMLLFGGKLLQVLHGIGVATASAIPEVIGLVLIKLAADIASHSNEHMVASALGSEN